MGAARTTTFPWAPATGGSCKRRGKKRALVAVGNQVLTIAYHLLWDPQARFADLGSTSTTVCIPTAEPGS